MRNVTDLPPERDLPLKCIYCNVAPLFSERLERYVWAHCQILERLASCERLASEVCMCTELNGEFSVSP